MALSEEIENMDEKFALLIISLQIRLGRMPTENEVILFIWGTPEERDEIWNS